MTVLTFPNTQEPGMKNGLTEKDKQQIQQCCMCLVPQLIGIETMAKHHQEIIAPCKQDLEAARNILNRILEDL